MPELDQFIERGHARRAGGVENYFCILQRQKIYKNFALVTKFNKPLSKELLSGPLRELMLKYPILASSIATTDYSDLSKPRPLHDYVKVINTITLEDVFMDLPTEIKECKDKAEQLALFNEITWKYGDEISLWQLMFLDEYTLVYLSNHVLSDGTSAKFFVSKLQHLLNQKLLSTKTLINYEKDWEKIPQLPPPIESIISYSPPLSFLPGYFLNLGILSKLCFSGISAHRDDKHSYRIIHLNFSKLSKLMTKLRENAVTMTPYIVNSAMNSMYQTVLKLSWLKLMDVVIPCDSRQFLPPGYDRDLMSFGSITGGSHYWYYPVKTQSWGSISYINKFFQYCKESKVYLYGLGILISDFLTWRTNLDKTIETATVNVPRSGLNYSNIGVIPQEEGEYEIEDVIFTKNAQGCINSFSMSSCSTKNGMNIVMTMAKGTVTEKEFDLISTIFEANIMSLI
jgi:alcohol O-acetyltransferase